MMNVCSSLIDWAATGAMLQGVGTLAGVGAVIVGALIGANAWKKQKQAERKLEVAERILTAAYNARSALRHVRSPMVWAHELAEAEDVLKEYETWQHNTATRKDKLKTAQAFKNRLNRTKDERLALEDCLPMARALFGERLENAVSDLRRQFWIVQIDVEAYVDTDEKNDRDFARKIRQSMSDIAPPTGERNEVSDTIHQAIQIIEDICLPALRFEKVKVAAK